MGSNAVPHPATAPLWVLPHRVVLCCALCGDGIWTDDERTWVHFDIEGEREIAHCLVHRDCWEGLTDGE